MAPRRMVAGASRALEWQGPDGPLSRVRDAVGTMLFTGSEVEPAADLALVGSVVELVSSTRVRVRWSDESVSEVGAGEVLGVARRR